MPGLLPRALLAILCLLSPLAAGTARAQNSTAQAIAATFAEGRIHDLLRLKAFYALRNDAPAWSGSPGAARDARTLEAALAGAADEGLEPADYRADLEQAPGSPRAAAESDLAHTEAALRYADDLRLGRRALRAFDRDVDLPEQSFDAPGALAAALETGTLARFLADLAPPQPDYARLKEVLKRYRAIAADGDWPQLPQRPAKAFAEDDGARALLQHRLAFEDPSATSHAQADVADQVARFQARHGLARDGRVGRQTLAALNVPAAERAWQIIANMERWRWLPRALEPRRVVINVPAASLDVFANDVVVLSSRVIVGRPHDPTPILRAEAVGVTVNPPWNVPAPIARKEILPKLKKDRGYLQSQDMVLRDGPPGDPYGLHVDWRALATMPYRIQQLPGEKNALGTVKLELPNRFDVYLHDTPVRSAFERDSRYLSHGCVRVEQILPLAAYALTGDPTAISSVSDAVALGTTETIPLSAPLPIYFLYWTVFVDADGSVEFRPDIYGRDKRLIAALRGGRNQSMTSLDVGCHPT